MELLGETIILATLITLFIWDVLGLKEKIEGWL